MHQVVLVAAGLNTRAFRLGTSHVNRVFKIDLPEVLGGRRTSCRHYKAHGKLPPDSSGGWSMQDQLTAGGARRQRIAGDHNLRLAHRRPALLPPRAAVDGLLETVHCLVDGGQPHRPDMMNRWLFLSPPAWPMQAALA